MKKIIRGKVWFWVDTIFDNDFIYDIYEDENGSLLKRIVCSR